jgi:hypothetical protein
VLVLCLPCVGAVCVSVCVFACAPECVSSDKRAGGHHQEPTQRRCGPPNARESARSDSDNKRHDRWGNGGTGSLNLRPRMVTSGPVMDDTTLPDWEARGRRLPLWRHHLRLEATATASPVVEQGLGGSTPAKQGSQKGKGWEGEGRDGDLVSHRTNGISERPPNHNPAHPRVLRRRATRLQDALCNEYGHAKAAPKRHRC